MAFGWAGAAAGAGDALQQMLTERRAAYLQQEQLRMQQEAAQRQAEQMAALERERASDREFREKDFAARQTEQQRIATRQQQQDDVAAGDRRQQQNAVGVRRMIGDFLVQRGSQPLDAGARQTLQGMALQEGVDLPANVAGDPDAPHKRALELENLRHTNDMAQIAAQGDQARRTVETRTQPQAANGPSAYTLQTAQRTIAAIDDVLPKINAFTAGPIGNIAARTGLYTPAVNVNAELQTVAGNIAFNALQQMRDASKTGGALGSIAQQELQLLQSVEGSMRQDQSPANLRAQLQKIRESQARFLAAASMGDAARPGRSGGPAAAGATDGTDDTDALLNELLGN